ncbi:GumC domain-containing protein [Lignipirellula cremea]|uniref:Uncharacterized protein n=1 Tax=Lignipirellula cremea TaxID=2528010 RepID=A0A518DU97_9BACT|nr:hypothetical protein [Lignipirellula cremea]QDU95399.1 hypothetical protein Pla8534_32140 [Lignipirellula cremea]
MNPSLPHLAKCRQVLQLLKKHYLLWLGPFALATAAGLFYSLFLYSPVWQSTQSMIVRDEAMGGISRVGRFEDTASMKTAQETIQDYVGKQSLLEAALVEAGPEGGWMSKPWPGPGDVKSFKSDVSIVAPNGTEFGKTEVLHLQVKAGTRERAIVLNKAVGDQLELGLKELRAAKAHSLIEELEKTLALARTELSEVTSRLEVVESGVGSDLGELRILNDVGSGESNLRQTLNQIKNELRQAQAAQRGKQEQERLLITAKQNSDLLVATSNQLLDSQPALRRLKDGLVDAQLRKAELTGKMNADHPLVRAAAAAENEVRLRLHDELDVALRGMQSDLQTSRAQVASLERQLAEVQGRLDALAKLRARYGNLVTELKQRTDIVERAQQNLANARASEAGARTSSLITRLDEPEVGNSPIGPGRTQIVAGAGLGGLLLGVGLVFLMIPINRMQGRRRTDGMAGSRQVDPSRVGRRAEDQQGLREGAAPASPGGHPQRRGEDRQGQRASDRPGRQRAGDANRPQRAADGPPSRRGEESPWATPGDQPAAAPSPSRAAAPRDASQGSRSGDRRGGDRRSSSRD